MKKVSLLLCLVLALMLGIQAASAQTVTLLSTGNILVTLDLRAGDTADAPSTASGDVTRVTVHRPGCADVVVSVAYADTENTKSLSDMTEQELNAMKAALLEDYPGADILTRTTTAGTLYLLADVHGDYDLHNMFTLFEGFYIELFQYHEDFSPMTEQDDAFLLDVLQGIWTREP